MEVNFIVDLDSFLYYVAHGLSARKGDPNTLETESQGWEFLNTVHLVISQHINRTRLQPRRIIFCKDSKLVWRSQLPAPEIAYKEDRKDKPKKFDKERFKTLSMEYFELVRGLGVFGFKKEYLESDDMLYLAADAFYEKGQSSVIMTRDSDMQQLIKTDGSSKFIVVWDYTLEKFIISSDFERRSDKLEDFLGGDDVFDFMNGGRYDVVDPYYGFMAKIFGGEKTDSVISSLYYFKGRATKKVSLTRPMATSFLKQYRKIDPKELLTNDRVQICEDIRQFLKTELNTEEMRDFVRQVKINLYFVWLNKQVIPKQLVGEFYGHNFMPVISHPDNHHNHQLAVARFATLLNNQGYGDTGGQTMKFMVNG